MTNPTKKNWEEDLSEYGALHNQDCCVNFDDARACDAGIEYVNCCENMMGLASFITTLIQKERKAEREYGRNEALGSIANIISAKMPGQDWNAEKTISRIEGFIRSPVFEASQKGTKKRS